MSMLSCVDICSHAVVSTITLNLHGDVFFRHKPPEVFTTKSLKNRGVIFDLHLRCFLQKVPPTKISQLVVEK